MKIFLICVLVNLTLLSGAKANWIKKAVDLGLYCNQVGISRQTIFYLDQSIIAKGDSNWYKGILYTSDYLPGERIQVVTIKDGGYETVSVWDTCYPDLTESEYKRLKSEDGLASLFTGNVNDRIKKDKKTFEKLFIQALTHPLYNTQHETTPKYLASNFPSKSIVEALYSDQERYRNGNGERRVVVFSDMFENSKHFDTRNDDPVQAAKQASISIPSNFKNSKIYAYGIGYTNSDVLMNKEMELFWSTYFSSTNAELVSYGASLSFSDTKKVPATQLAVEMIDGDGERNELVKSEPINEIVVDVNPKTIMACDSAAAHPDDPNRAAAGVPDSGLAIVIAVRVCSEAVEQDPSNARIWFQYGRALWLNQRYEDAVAAFAEAAEIGYAPAEKYIGDAFLEGKGLPEGQVKDVYTALDWYTKSADNGFVQAESAVAEVSKYIKQHTFDSSIFKRGDFMGHLYHGTHKSIGKSVDLYHYAKGIYEFLDSEQAMDHAPECKPLLAKMGQININLGKLGAIFSSLQSGSTSEEVMGTMLGLWFDSALGIEHDHGKRDAVTLINVHGCDTDVAHRITDSLINM